MSETDGTLSRREAIMTTAKVVGVAAFAAPVVVGVFSAPAFGATVICDGSTNSRAILATVSTGYTKNTNCGGNGIGPAGRYVGQNSSFTVPGTTGGTVQVGLVNNDNFDVQISFFTITSPEGFCCIAKFVVGNCPSPETVTCSNPTQASGQPYRYSLPYCSDCSSAKLILQSVYCCPTSAPCETPAVNSC